MTRRLLVSLLFISIATSYVGCISKDSKEEGSVAASSDETFAEEAPADAGQENPKLAEAEIKSDSAAAPADVPEGGDDLALDDETAAKGKDQLSIDEGNASKEPTVSEQASGTAEEKPLFAAEEKAKTEPAPAPTEPAIAPNNEPPQVAEATPNPNTDVNSGFTPASEEPVASAPAPESGVTPEQSVVSIPSPLQKIKDAPFNKGKALLNRVYISRKGDKTKSVASKIYGSSSRSKDLVSWNPVLSRGMKIGDKVYYQSPLDPTDALRMMTYYEEKGIPASVHVTQGSENIRKLARSLLGATESWKELWATNITLGNDAKVTLSPGTEIRYWPDEIADAPLMAKTESVKSPGAPPQQTLPQMAQRPSSSGQAPSEGGVDPLSLPPGQQPSANAGAGIAPPAQGDPSTAPPSSASAGIGAANPEPPPIENPPAPPPAPVAEAPAPPAHKENRQKADPASDSAAMGTDPDTLMTIAAAGILAITAAVLLVIVRRKRLQKQQMMAGSGVGRPDMVDNFGQTQV
jgi:hypothetical protein